MTNDHIHADFSHVKKCLTDLYTAGYYKEKDQNFFQHKTFHHISVRGYYTNVIFVSYPFHK